MRLRVLESCGRTEAYLNLARTARAHASYACMLVKLERTPEATTAGPFATSYAAYRNAVVRGGTAAHFGRRTKLSRTAVEQKQNGSHVSLIGQPLGHQGRLAENLSCVSMLDDQLAEGEDLKTNLLHVFSRTGGYQGVVFHLGAAATTLRESLPQLLAEVVAGFEGAGASIVCDPVTQLLSINCEFTASIGHIMGLRR